MLILACLLAIFATDNFTAVVIDAHDGDTLTVRDDRDDAIHKVRVDGIDAPELGQPHGDDGRAELLRLVRGRRVELSVRSKDRYGRLLATVTVDDRDVGLSLVRSGWAWKYPRSIDKRLIAAEKNARDKRVGLWTDAKPVAPWTWRREHRK